MSQLNEAVERIKAGDRENGRKLLVEFLKANPESELGWLWLASVTQNLDRQEQYLKRVLKLNPNNKHAQKRLSTLMERQLSDEEPPFTDPPQKPQHPDPTPKPPKKPKKERGCLELSLIAIGVFFVCAIFSAVLEGFSSSSTGENGLPKTPSPDPFAAWVMCKEFVEDSLVAPSTAEFGSYNEGSASYLGNNEYLVRNYVDAQNSFGAMLRNNFSCKVRDNNETWSLLQLQIE